MIEPTSGNRPEGPSRLCHVIKSPDFNGYGFNLHAEKSKNAQYIGHIDEGSPAELAGLREGDRILEVNGVDIRNETHKQVVHRIKMNPNETKLLVTSPGAEEANNKEAAESDKPPETDVSAPPANNHHNEEKTNVGLKLNMTVAEMRAQLANKKKYDPKKESIDFKKKFDIVQKL